MRRNNPPYKGKRYVLNKNTLEVHDLDRETPKCRIDEIKPDHVYNCDSFMEAVIHSLLDSGKECNGCAYCMPEENTD